MVTLVFAAALNSAFMFSQPENQGDTLSREGKQLYVKTQYAGNMGLISVGAGYDSGNKLWSMDMNYGFLPGFINGVRVHSLAYKPAFHFVDLSFTGLEADGYIGVGVLFNIGRGIYAKVPDYYDRNYYLPNAFHLIPCIGVRSNFKLKKEAVKKFSVFAEIGTVDYRIYFERKNSKINFSDIWNFSFGFALRNIGGKVP